MDPIILAIDQGTTGSTALVMGLDGKTLGRATVEFPQHFPEPGWVEHDPTEIWQSVNGAVAEALRSSGVAGSRISAIGITNQRETTLLWDKVSGRPIYPAIVWQDRRTAPTCVELNPQADRVRALTGLVIDPYFSATKIAWILDHVAGARRAADAGELRFGTVDSYLIWRLCGADQDAPHVSDVTNASRTLLMDLDALSWSAELCELFRVPPALLPSIVPNTGIVGRTRAVPSLPDGIPITGVAGDQHAALFGQACFALGDAKCTFGTGAFVLANTGATRVHSRFGLISTLAWQISGHVSYALEGSCFVSGAAVQWLRDGLGLINSAAEIQALAESVPSSAGVTFVPALAGLGAPHWDATASGLITGITRGTTKAHLARATLEAMAFQVNDLLTAMADDLGHPLDRLRVDGGAAANDLLLQIQSNLSQLRVERPTELESTARGAAMLAGLGAGLFPDQGAAAAAVHRDREFLPQLAAAERESELKRWSAALRRTSSAAGREM